MTWIYGTMATCGFELMRSMTLQRMAVALVLLAFPPVMLALLILGPQVVSSSADLGYVEFVIVFLISIVCLLALLLWATPNVYSELEGKSWIFVASRPGGRIAVLLGKYLAAVIFSFGICFVALTACVLISELLTHSVRDPMRLWLALTGIYSLACLVYGAVFSMIGTLYYRRAMVIAAGYLVGSEAILANFPALVSRFTMRYHLQSLGIEWIGWFLPGSRDEYVAIFGPPAQWFHLTSLATVVVVCLSVGVLTIVSRQYLTGDET